MTIIFPSRWDRYENLQYSEPVYLEAGRPYYFEALSNNFPGPWDLGVAAKLHDSELNGGLYDSDKEEQSIEISSSTVQEIQVSVGESSGLKTCTRNAFLYGCDRKLYLHVDMASFPPSP